MQTPDNGKSLIDPWDFQRGKKGINRARIKTDNSKALEFFSFINVCGHITFHDLFNGYRFKLTNSSTLQLTGIHTKKIVN